MSLSYGTLYAEYERGKPLRGTNGELFAYGDSRVSGRSFSKVGSSFWVNDGFRIADGKKIADRIGIVTPENHFIYTRLTQSRSDHHWMNKYLFGRGSLSLQACFSSRYGGAVCYRKGGILFPMWPNIRIDLSKQVPVQDYEIYTLRLDRSKAQRIRQRYKKSIEEAALFLQPMNDGVFQEFSTFAHDVYMSEGGSSQYWYENPGSPQNETKSFFADKAVKLMDSVPIYSFIFQMLAVFPSTLYLIKKNHLIRQSMILYSANPKDLMSLYYGVTAQFGKRHLFLAHGDKCFQRQHIPLPYKGAPYSSSSWGINLEVNGNRVKQF